MCDHHFLTNNLFVVFNWFVVVKLYPKTYCRIQNDRFRLFGVHYKQNYGLYWGISEQNVNIKSLNKFYAELLRTGRFDLSLARRGTLPASSKKC